MIQILLAGTVRSVGGVLRLWIIVSHDAQSYIASQYKRSAVKRHYVFQKKRAQTTMFFFCPMCVLSCVVCLCPEKKMKKTLSFITMGTTEL